MSDVSKTDRVALRTLDPRTAHANWAHAETVPGSEQIGRVAYWYDPNRPGSYRDQDMWEAWPELHSEWRELKRRAYERCQQAGEAAGEDPDVLPYGWSFGGLLGTP